MFHTDNGNCWITYFEADASFFATIFIAYYFWIDKALLQWHHCTHDLEEIEAGDEAGVASNSPAAPLAGVSDVMVFTDPTLQGFSKMYLEAMSKKNLDL